MSTNPHLYPRHYAEAMKMRNPQISYSLFNEGYMYAETSVNLEIGASNEVARIAISDGIEFLKKAGKYKQKTKQLCRETFRRMEQYEAIHNHSFGDRQPLWLDYLDGMEDEFKKHIFNVYIAVKMVLDKHGESSASLKAMLECGRICADVAVDKYDALMLNLKKRFGVDYSPIFSMFRYDRPLFTWSAICDIYVKFDNPRDVIDIDADNNLRMAVNVLCSKLSDEDILNRIGERAIKQNLDIVREYASAEDLLELGIH